MPRQRRGTEIMAWRPMRDIDRVFDEMEETFEDVFGRPFYPVTWGRTPEVRAWSPPLEIYETDNIYAVRMELPGIDRKDIHILATEDTVTIAGERQAPEDAKEEDYVLCERCYGSFERTITFPTDIETDKITADFENGILELNAPKAVAAVGEKIEIKASNPRQVTQESPGVTRQTGDRAGTRRPTHGTASSDLEKQQTRKESRASAAEEKAAFKYEQTGNPAQLGSDVHGELPGQTGEIGEMNRSGGVKVVQTGEKAGTAVPTPNLKTGPVSAGREEIPGQTGDIGDESPGDASTAR